MDGQSKRCPRCATERKEKSFGQQNTHTPLPILTAARPTQAHSASLSPHCPFLKIISLDIETHRAEEEEETHVSQGVLTRKTLHIIHFFPKHLFFTFSGQKIGKLQYLAHAQYFPLFPTPRALFFLLPYRLEPRIIIIIRDSSPPFLLFLLLSPHLNQKSEEALPPPLFPSSLSESVALPTQSQENCRPTSPWW